MKSIKVTSAVQILSLLLTVAGSSALAALRV